MNTSSAERFGMVVSLVCLILSSCSSESATGEPSMAAGAMAGGSAGKGADVSKIECAVEVKDADCDKTKRPFVFVHGTYGSGDNIGNVALLFGSNPTAC